MTTRPLDVSTDLTGRTALVTGAGSGLGRRFAEALALSGANVVLAGRREELLQTAAADIIAAGGRAHTVRLDLMDHATVVAAVDVAQAHFGPVDILVNNAAQADASVPHHLDRDVADALVGTNLRGTWDLTMEVGRRLIDRRAPGTVVNVSSMAAFDYSTHKAPFYSITKAAIVRMTEVLAVEWARHRINVNCVVPGAFESEMLGEEKDMERLARHFPRRRICQPHHLDSTLLFLVSPASEVITGAVVKADDGQFHR